MISAGVTTDDGGRRWVRPPEQAEDPGRITRQALALGKAVYDQRRAPRLSVAELAQRAAMAAR